MGVFQGWGVSKRPLGPPLEDEPPEPDAELVLPELDAELAPPEPDAELAPPEPEVIELPALTDVAEPTELVVDGSGEVPHASASVAAPCRSSVGSDDFLGECFESMGKYRLDPKALGCR